MKTLSKYIPELGLNLARFSGHELLQKVGDQAIRDVVTSILCGGNVRTLTEGLTQRRVALANAALLVAYLRASRDIENLPDKLSRIVAHELANANITQAHRMFLQWFIGLTGKSIQNVLRSDQNQLEAYLAGFEEAIHHAVKEAQSEFGALQASVTLGQESCPLNWQAALQLFAGIGAQTLAIRGAEKSMYGKLFEKLILGAMLSVLDFQLTDPQQPLKSKKVFWLSQRGNKRESDATLLYKPGVGARFDIGFIGPGNTEISLDKVSRFEREMEPGKQRHFMATIILVDRIGERSRIAELAQKIDGNIVQMSMTFWAREVAEILRKKIGFKHEILRLPLDESIPYIQHSMQHLDLKQFISV